MAFNGVRNSWLTVARKRLLAALAASGLGLGLGELPDQPGGIGGDDDQADQKARRQLGIDVPGVRRHDDCPKSHDADAGCDGHVEHPEPKTVSEDDPQIQRIKGRRRRSYLRHQYRDRSQVSQDSQYPAWRAGGGLNGDPRENEKGGGLIQGDRQVSNRRMVGRSHHVEHRVVEQNDEDDHGTDDRLLVLGIWPVRQPFSQARGGRPDRLPDPWLYRHDVLPFPCLEPPSPPQRPLHLSSEFDGKMAIIGDPVRRQGREDSE